jgi:plastocyanin
MKTHYNRKLLIVITILLSTAIFSCKKDNSAAPIVPNSPKTSNSVSIENMAFSPSTLTVSAGTTVSWTNNDGVTHTVTSKTSAFDSGSLLNGKTYSFTFPNAGTYDYYCKIHTSMTGSIVVQ